MSRSRLSPRSGAGSASFTLDSGAVPPWRESKVALERWLLTLALAESAGNMAEAARRLGITKVAVLHAVRRHELGALTRGHR